MGDTSIATKIISTEKGIPKGIKVSAMEGTATTDELVETNS